MPLISTFFHSWPFIIRRFLSGAAFITSITFFVFFKTKWIGYFEASILLSLMTFMPVLAEIPTGAFADTYGRKKSTLVSIFIEIACLIAIIATNSFPILICIFIIWGIGNTFSSGATNAWAIDRFPLDTKESHMENYFAMNSSAFSAGMVLAGIISSLLLSFFSGDSVWWFRLWITLISFGSLLFIHEQFTREDSERHSYAIFLESIKDGVRVLRKSITLQYLIGAEFFLAVALFLVSGAAMQSFLVSAGLKENIWWSIYSTTAFVTVFVPIFAMKASRLFKKKTNYLVLILIAQALLFFLATLLVNPIYATFLLFFYNISEDLFNPVASAFFHKHIPSKVRATVESFQSAILAVGYTIGMLWGGYISEHLSWSWAMTLSLLFFWLSALFYGKAENHGK